MTSLAERDKKAYELAKDFLLQLNVEGVTAELLDKYLRPSEIMPRLHTIPEIYRHILLSAQNANMKAGVIGKAIGGIDRLGPVLCDFRPDDILAKFPDGWEQVLDEIERELKPAGKVRRTPKSLWPRFCQTILSAAHFTGQFTTADDFYRWADFFDRDDRARVALPMLLDKEIAGFGFALACGFLKDLGYSNFAKPDVHLRDIFISLQLCNPKADDYQVFKAIVRMAKHVGVTAYNADKLLWLIGSGYFHDDKHIGNEGKIGNHKTEFIALAQTQLGQ